MKRSWGMPAYWGWGWICGLVVPLALAGEVSPPGASDRGGESSVFFRSAAVSSFEASEFVRTVSFPRPLLLRLRGESQFSFPLAEAREEAALPVRSGGALGSNLVNGRGLLSGTTLFEDTEFVSLRSMILGASLRVRVNSQKMRWVYGGYAGVVLLFGLLILDRMLQAPRPSSRGGLAPASGEIHRFAGEMQN